MIQVLYPGRLSTYITVTNLNGLVSHTRAYRRGDLWPFCIAAVLLVRTVTSFISEDTDEGRTEDLREKKKRKKSKKCEEESGIKREEERGKEGGRDGEVIKRKERITEEAKDVQKKGEKMDKRKENGEKERGRRR